MKTVIFRSLFLAILSLFFVNSGFTQIKKVSYELVYNSKSKLYDCYLVVHVGSTHSTRDRIQFNSQVSLVVATGTEIAITDLNMPLQDNQNYKGTDPAMWEVTKPLVAPSVDPGHDYFSIRPNLFPAALYNDIKEGEKIKLFSFKAVHKSKSKGEMVRLFKNGVDPSQNEKSMLGRDFSQGFCMGGPEQLYSTTIDKL